MQVASGVLNQPPVDKPGAFQIAVQTQGRLADPDEFGNIVVKQTANAVVRVKDVATVELAAQDYSIEFLSRSRSGGRDRRCSSGPARTRCRPRRRSATPWRSFPSGSRPGLKYTIVYDPTQFIQQSVDAVEETIVEAIILVVLVVIMFLQTWRAAVIPIVAIPVSLIGTFFFMAMFGFTLNNLSLFGLVLAIGIVVDDAIVVVENVERNIEAGLEPARRGDQEHGRGRRGADRDRAGADRGVRAVGLHHRHFRAVLPAVRAHHRRRDRSFR